MKRLFVGCIATFCSLWGLADNAFSIADFSIAAGEEKTIEVKMFHDVNIAAFQFVLDLPDGISITKVTATNRLKKWDEDEEAYVPVHSVVTSTPESGKYKVMAYATPSTNIAGSSGTAVVKLKFKASDQVSTGTFTPAMTKQEMTELDGTKHKIDDATYKCTATLSTTVTTLGYATFSWPKALDFTGSGLTAFIATSCTGSLHLESVTKVPANTGLILKGVAGSENTYQLETTDDDALDDVSANLLTSNTSGAYTVTTDNVYVLSNLDNGTPGFYLAANGVHVGQYKSYLVLSTNPARRQLAFDETPTALSTIHEGRQWMTDAVYDMQGREVKSQTVRKGVYVKNGKKMVIR